MRVSDNHCGIFGARIDKDGAGLAFIDSLGGHTTYGCYYFAVITPHVLTVTVPGARKESEIAIDL